MNQRILHVIESFELEAGSIAYAVHDLVRELASRGSTVRVATLKDGPSSSEGSLDGIEVCRLSGAEGKPARLASCMDKIDCVHLHGLNGSLIRSAAAAAGRARIQYCVSPYGALAPNPFERLGLFRRMLERRRRERVLQGAGCVLAYDDSETEQLKNRGVGVRVELSPLGIDPKRFEIAGDREAALQSVPALAERRCLLFLGRIHPAEGLVPLLRAGEELADMLEGWHLVLAGRGANAWQRQVEAAIRRRGEEDRVTVVANPDARLQAALLARADVLVQPALYETPPMAALMGMSAGVPVLASRKCGLSELESAGAGKIAEPSRGSLAKALRSILSASDEERRAMGQAGKRFVKENAHVRETAARHEQLFASLMGRQT